jgi:hypothetical protein
MKTHVNKILLFVASQEWPSPEIEQSLLELRRVQLHELMFRIRRLRRIANVSHDVDLPSDREESRPEGPARSAYSASFIDDVITLLQIEAELDTREVAEALSKSLLGSPEAFILRKKESLRRWLQRLSEVKEPRVILQHATRIRNSIVRTGKEGWTLDDVRTSI